MVNCPLHPTKHTRKRLCHAMDAFTAKLTWVFLKRSLRLFQFFPADVRARSTLLARSGEGRDAANPKPSVALFSSPAVVLVQESLNHVCMGGIKHLAQVRHPKPLHGHEHGQRVPLGPIETRFPRRKHSDHFKAWRLDALFYLAFK